MEVAEIEAFIGTTLEEYSEKVRISRPVWELIDPLEEPEKIITKIGLGAASYSPREQRVYFNEHIFRRAWKKDKEKAIRFIRFIIAEEYWHHVQKIRGVVFFTRFGDVRPRIEREAKKMAEELSGISKEEHRALSRWYWRLK